MMKLLKYIGLLMPLLLVWQMETTETVPQIVESTETILVDKVCQSPILPFSSEAELLGNSVTLHLSFLCRINSSFSKASLLKDRQENSYVYSCSIQSIPISRSIVSLLSWSVCDYYIFALRRILI